MSTDQRIRSRKAFRQPMAVIGICMTVFYIGFGSFLLLYPNLISAYPAFIQQLFAAMLLVYGVFRGWRVYNDYFRRQPETEAEIEA
ncbi:MAG: hypothetical protein J0L99_18485 [Chitinophagales bacterium]|nr:hypothetical protein [Chitinophagales bacterium]